MAQGSGRQTMLVGSNMKSLDGSKMLKINNGKIIRVVKKFGLDNTPSGKVKSVSTASTNPPGVCTTSTPVFTVPNLPITITACAALSVPSVSTTVTSAQITNSTQTDCHNCEEKDKTIRKMQASYCELKSKTEYVERAHKELLIKHKSLQKKYNQKLKMCELEHESCKPPILTLSPYIDLF